MTKIPVEQLKSIRHRLEFYANPDFRRGYGSQSRQDLTEGVLDIVLSILTAADTIPDDAPGNAELLRAVPFLDEAARETYRAITFPTALNRMQSQLALARPHYEAAFALLIPADRKPTATSKRWVGIIRGPSAVAALMPILLASPSRNSKL